LSRSSSPAITSSARLSSLFNNASLLLLTWVLTRATISSSLLSNRSNFVSMSSIPVCFCFGLTKSPGNVVLGLLHFRVGEKSFCLPVFDQLAQVEKGRSVTHTAGLLHIVRDDHDCICVF